MAKEEAVGVWHHSCIVKGRGIRVLLYGNPGRGDECPYCGLTARRGIVAGEVTTHGAAPAGGAPEFVKHDAGKPRYDLIIPEAMDGIARVLAIGAAKYADRNWERGAAWGRYFGAAMRHLWAWWGGEDKDPETGESHLHHAACCIMFLQAYEARKIGKDDRRG